MVDPSGVYIEREDTLQPCVSLPSIVERLSPPPAHGRKHSPCLFVCQDSGHVIRTLDDAFKDHPEWQFRATPIDTELYKPNRPTNKPPTILRTVVVNFFGFRGEVQSNSDGKSRRRLNRYHHLLDPHQFIQRFTLDDLASPRPGETDLMQLYRWGAALRDWASREGLTVKPTAGGFGGQLLRDARFYPEARRKVPRATNDRARDLLPGNYYELRVNEDERQSFSATYFDQVSSHHSIAATLPLPDANRLYAKGRFQTLEGKPWAKRHTRLFDAAIKQHGLFLVTVKNPHYHPDAFVLPCQKRKGWHDVFVWSNEIPFLRETGTTILAIMAAWTSDYVDTGIPRYARWALSQLRENAEHSAWLKPTLLSTYGNLAARPRRFETAYRQGERGERTTYVVGGAPMELEGFRSNRELESNISNVIQRGMIESETRLRSIRMAAHLHSHKLRVLAIYADSVFVENAGQNLPLISGNWQVKRHLTRLQWFNSTSFTSDQLTKLPGIPKDDRDRLSRVQAHRAFFAELAKIEKGERRARGKTSDLPS